jgi:hypothetical protein
VTTNGGARATPWAAVPELPAGDAGTGVQDRGNADAGPLIESLRALRAGLGEVELSLRLRGAEEATATAAALVNQIDDYLLPRMEQPETPPLLVIGGSTGGGKSTLLNTFVGTPVSPAGVLRPTTRSPVLVCHPDDYRVFASGGPLPTLPRSSGGAPRTLRVLSSPAVPAGLALVDAPDVDSVEATNRELAGRLLIAADLWIFVTTAARYADALPWDLLRSAVARGASVAVVLSRVNHLAHATVSTHLRELLRAEGLGAAPLFVIEQSQLDANGLLPEPAIRGLRSWIGRVAASPTQRTAIVRQTLSGALAALPDRVDAIADATRDQHEAIQVLRADIRDVFRAADARLRAAIDDGVLFRGDIVGHWQEYAGNGGLNAIVQSRSNSKSGSLSGAASIRAGRVRAGLVGGVVRLFTAVAEEAASGLVDVWQNHLGGAAAARGHRLEHASAEAAKNAEEAARGWLDAVDAAVAGPHGNGVRAAAVAVLVSAALKEGTLPVGREVDIAGGTVTLSTDLLSGIFEAEKVREAGNAARTDLLIRLSAALAGEEQRFAAHLDTLDPPAELTDRLRDAGRYINRQRTVVTRLFGFPGASPLAIEAAPAPAVTVEAVISDAGAVAGREIAAAPAEREEQR